MNHRQKRRDERVNWRFFFRTSNGQRCSQQPVGLRRDGAVISWQRGAGRVGTARLTSKPGRPRESWRRTHSFCLCKKRPSKKQKMESGIQLDCWTLQKQCERSGDHWESQSNEWWRWLHLQSPSIKFPFDVSESAFRCFDLFLCILHLRKQAQSIVGFLGNLELLEAQILPWEFPHACLKVALSNKRKTNLENVCLGNCSLFIFNLGVPANSFYSFQIPEMPD